MNFTKFDVTLLVVMTMAIILMSFVMPAVGLAGDSNETSESEVPEFDIDSSRFDMVGDFPERPGSSKSGTLEFDEARLEDMDTETIEGYTFKWVDRPKDSGTSIELQNLSGQSPRILVADYVGGSPDSYVDTYPLSATDVGETITHKNNSWSIEFSVDEIDNYDDPNMTMAVSYDVLANGGSSSDSGGGLSSIPVIGTLFEAGSELASSVVWIGEVVYWGVIFVFEIGINMIGMLFDAMVFTIDLMNYMITTYADVVSQATSWASVVLLVPGMILFAEFAKLTMVGISLLPTT